MGEIYSCAAGGFVSAGRFRAAFRWSVVSAVSFSTGVAKSVPIHHYLEGSHTKGNLKLGFSGSLPAGVTFNQSTGSLVYSGTGSGSGSGSLSATTIPCNVAISFLPTAATWPIPNYNSHEMQLEYPFSFAHQFIDGQVLPNTSVYCLSVKNGIMYQDSAYGYAPSTEKFRVDPLTYWPSGCLKDATISGQFMAVWKPYSIAVAANLVQLVAVAETVTYAAPITSPLAGTKRILYESVEASETVTSNTFSVVVA